MYGTRRYPPSSINTGEFPFDEEVTYINNEISHGKTTQHTPHPPSVAVPFIPRSGPGSIIIIIAIMAHNNNDAYSLSSHQARRYINN